ncbi:MAG: tetratricopeptide repeat protein [Betaproteobacteria bacterium]|uniref:Tetratricopeptide repeat protein n=1 Tax=Candidatus Proximibacter danicus TaxID=2954365 RepID=A0A9D7K2B6_9PROT|nr:tetratricopeptide repeat protein [Candidatus Proximibacter danicus]
MMRRAQSPTLLRCLLLAALFTGAGPALSAAEDMPASAPERAAASADAIRSEAVRLLEQERPDAAYRLLKPLHDRDEGDIGTAFLLGQAAMLSNRPAEAVTIYQAILARDPNLPRVRLELGRAYAAREAKKHSSMPCSQQSTAGRRRQHPAMIESIPSQKRWNVRLSGGYLYDSNVNAGPMNGSVLMFGLPFLLSRDSLKRSDSGYTFSLGASHPSPLDGSRALQTDVQYTRTDYTTLDQFNSDIFSLSAGPTWRQGGNIYSLPLLFENVLIGQQRFSTAVGIAPQVLLPVTGRLFLNAAMTGQAKDYHVSEGVRDGTLWPPTTLTEHLPAGHVPPRRGKNAEEYIDNRSDGLSLAFHAALPAGFSSPCTGATKTRYAAQEQASIPDAGIRSTADGESGEGIQKHGQHHRFGRDWLHLQPQRLEPDALRVQAQSDQRPDLGNFLKPRRPITPAIAPKQKGRRIAPPALAENTVKQKLRSACRPRCSWPSPRRRKLPMHCARPRHHRSPGP